MAPELTPLWQGLVASRSFMPVEVMEHLLAAGEPAAALVAASLAGEDPVGAPRDRLHLLVLAGELRRPSLTEGLLEQLRVNTVDSSLAMAASEGLGKIGAPAVEALAGFLERETNAAARLYALGALGHIRSRESEAVLRRALESEEELVDVAAQALAQLGGEGTLQEVYHAYRRAPETWNAPLEEAIRYLAGVDPLPPHPIERDWRVRYRRRPALDWEIVSSWEGHAAAVHADPELPRRMREAAPGKRTLEEIVSAESEAPPEWVPVSELEAVPRGYCPSCGNRTVRVGGAMVCPVLARRGLGAQRHMLLDWRDELDATIFDKLDEVETADARFTARLQELDEAARAAEAGVEEEEEAAGERPRIRTGIVRLRLAQETLLFLVEEGCRTIGDGIAQLARLEERAPRPDREAIKRHRLTKG